MSSVDKQDRTLTALGLGEPGLELVFQELRLRLDIGFGGNGPYLAIAEVETFFKNCRT